MQGTGIKPRLLDLFCGAGGAAKGYADAGFEVVGVDIEPQPNYPFEFYHADALAMTRDVVRGCWHESSSKTSLNGMLDRCLGHFDAIHASPPCQASSPLRHLWKDREYPELIQETRELLVATHLPYVIENVVGAKLLEPFMLCGSMFGNQANGRQLRRHRLFEANFPVLVSNCCHRGQPVGVYGHGGGGSMIRGYKGSKVEYQEAMEMPWATKAEISQAIPPSFTRHIGMALLIHLPVTTARYENDCPRESAL